MRFRYRLPHINPRTLAQRTHAKRRAEGVLAPRNYGVYFGHQRQRFIDSFPRRRHPKHMFVEFKYKDFGTPVAHGRAPFPADRRERDRSLSHRRPLAAAGDVENLRGRARAGESIRCRFRRPVFPPAAKARVFSSPAVGMAGGGCRSPAAREPPCLRRTC
jgi:hypothetical protein